MTETTEHKTEKTPFWKMAARHVGRPMTFETPELLWTACIEYFQWTIDNPIESEDLFAYQGEVTRETIQHPRAMTIGAMCAFIGICRNTWKTYMERDEFLTVTTRVDEAIREQKFTGAAAGLLKENIIAREMGLADKKENKVSGAIGINIIEDEKDV